MNKNSIEFSLSTWTRSVIKLPQAKSLYKNCYPIPRIADLIESLSKASIFTKIDLRWRYNNVCIKEENE